VKVEVAAPPPELPTAVDQASYRILQESITNAIRHASPARVTVSLTYGPDDLEILVADNGHGPRDSGGADGGGRGSSACGSAPPCSAGADREPTAGWRVPGAARLPLESARAGHR
jgi:hypothetical protein